jgi:putative phage-type endonuclease
MLTPEQLELRKDGIGASDVAAIVGLHPYRTAMDVWLEHPRIGVKPPFTGNEATEGGNILEPVIAAEYVRRGLGKILIEKPDTYQHEDYPWALATPDRICLDAPDAEPHVLECKAVGSYSLRDWDDKKEDGIPEYVYVQIQWQMFVTGYERADVGAMLAGPYFRFWLGIQRNDSVIDKLFRRCERFWTANILANTPPEITGEYIKAKHPTGNGMMLPATEYTTKLHEEIKGIKEATALLKQDLDAKTNELKAIVGDADGITGICSYDKLRRLRIK